ncbi:MAG: 1-deoxy-D-xylulose-5-phosphate reductoisomerase [Bacteroidales bacterium]|nr:1-deoxy-D-xylulose-5-phosphate reductoisomerase [Bacteroidales bacterium]
MKKRKIAILGSTGSIGRQALEVVAEHPDLFQVELLTANTSAALLAEQALRFDVNQVVLHDERAYRQAKDLLADSMVKVYAGTTAVEGLMETMDVDVVLSAQVGFSGLEPTLAALRHGKAVALSNKESLVAAGSLVMRTAREHQAPVLPVDSEHSAIFQCLQGQRGSLEKLLLTASGGPFLHHTAEQMKQISKAEALRHPRWNMGEKITIDCATLMNKGLEMIEAHWLFDMAPEAIQIVVHPQSIIHSMVQFTDGTVLAQMSNPDMRIPIQYALAYPERPSLSIPRLDFAAMKEFTFLEPDLERFPCIRLAYDTLALGGNLPCAMNAANEEAVWAFLREELPFSRIPAVIEQVLSESVRIAEPVLEDIIQTDHLARIKAQEWIYKWKTN